MNTTTMRLRGYQEEAFRKAKDENTILVMGTGTGKTLVAVKMIDLFLSRGKCAFLVPTRELVRQQASYIRSHAAAASPIASVAVAEVCGNEIEGWSASDWQECCRNHQVINKKKKKKLVDYLGGSTRVVHNCQTSALSSSSFIPCYIFQNTMRYSSCSSSTL